MSEGETKYRRKSSPAMDVVKVRVLCETICESCESMKAIINS